VGKQGPGPKAKPLLVYTTFGNADDAERVGAHLVAERLAACANILPPMRSVYEWNGELTRESETAMLLKSVEARRDALVARLVELHPYETPAVLILPVDGGAAPFVAWLEAQTAPARVIT